MDPLTRVCVYGSGTLGWQISLQTASYGHEVNLYDISEKALDNAIELIGSELDRRVVAGEIRAVQKRVILGRVHRMASPKEAVAGVDLVIEAVPERLDVKRTVFRELDGICAPETIIATNSSSIRVSKIEDATKRLDRVLNTHFYSYPWKSGVVELMKGTKTSDETIARVDAFMRDIGVLPLHVRKESTGFIHNRVWRAVQDVDRAWMRIYGTDAGPFGLMDRVGLDVVRDIEMVYYSESGQERDRPPRILLDKIEKGELGVKTGRGFYTYPDPEYSKKAFLRP